MISVTNNLYYSNIAPQTTLPQQTEATFPTEQTVAPPQIVDSLASRTVTHIPALTTSAIASELTPVKGIVFVPIDQEYAENLKIFFNRCNIPNKPTFEGSEIKQAEQIRAWLIQNRAEIEKIRYLNLSHSLLSTVPQEMQLFVNLWRLNLSHCNLTTLPNLYQVRLTSKNFR